MVGDHLKFIDKMLRRSDEQARLEGMSNKAWHSSFYHSQYEGYSEYYTYDKQGKKRLQRVYTAAYYRMDQTAKQKRLYALVQVLLLAAAITLFLLGASRQAVCNTRFYVTVFQALLVLTMVWTLSGVAGRFFVPEDMTIGQYRKTTVRVRRASLCSSICLFAVAAAALVAAVLEGDGLDVQSVLCAGLFLCAGGVMLFMNRAEARIEVLVVDNPTAEPPGSIQIEH